MLEEFKNSPMLATRQNSVDEFHALILPLSAREESVANDAIDISFDPLPLVIAYIRTLPSDRHKRDMLRNFFWVRDMRTAGAMVKSYLCCFLDEFLAQCLSINNSKGKS